MQGRINNSREDELNTIRKQNRELQEQNSEDPQQLGDMTI